MQSLCLRGTPNAANLDKCRAQGDGQSEDRQVLTAAKTDEFGDSDSRQAAQGVLMRC